MTTALVTGASGGIGAAVVRTLADEGLRVLAHDLLPTACDAEAKAGDGRQICDIGGDLRSDDCVEELRVRLADERVSAVIAAHGVDGSGALAMLEPAYIRRVMEINFATVTRLYAAAAPTLAREHGSFVVVSSANGLLGEAENSAYCASKFAVVGWVRAIARSEAKRGVSLHVICPGCTDTPMLRQGLQGFAQATGRSTQEVRDDYLASIPAGRFGRPEEIAGAIACMLQLRRAAGAIWAVTGGQVLA